MYKVKTLSAKAGKDTFYVHQQANGPAQLTIVRDTKTVGATPTFTVDVKVLTVTISAGTYTFECTVPGHAAADMQATLTVS